MEMTLGAAAVARKAETPATSFSKTLAVLIALGVAMGGWAGWVATEARVGVLPSVLAEIATWVACVALLIWRSPRKEFQLSELGTGVMIWCFYFLISPAITWLSGRRFAYENGHSFVMTQAGVEKVQWLHVLFLVVFTATYHLVAPRVAFEPLDDNTLRHRMPRVQWLFIAGLVPLLITIASRVATTGTIGPQLSYGDMQVQLTEGVDAARGVGGVEYVLWQAFSKVLFYPMMAFGVSIGVLLARAFRFKQWGVLAALHGMIPVLLYLQGGTRSAVFFQFIIAVVFADHLLRGLSKKYLVIAATAGILFFNFYGWFRGYQNMELSQAMAETQHATEMSADVEYSEEGGMLAKEVYTVQWVDEGGFDLDWDHFAHAPLMLIPQQILPDKTRWTVVALVLSEQLIGREAVARGQGVAGALLVDGYMVEREVGVGAVAVFFALACALLLRVLVRETQALQPIWRVALLSCMYVQVTTGVRSDLSLLCMQLFYYLAVPMVVIRVLPFTPGETWSLGVRATFVKRG